VRLAGRPTALLICAVVVAGVLAACGSGGGHSTSSAAGTLSVTAYRARLTAACVANYRASARLPTLQRDQHLTITELERRAQQIEQRYSVTITSLKPPPSLRSAHAQLLALGRRPQPARPTVKDALAANQRAVAVYRRLGVPTCVKLLQRAGAKLRGS
jgi:hypothetical protein